MSPDAGPPGRAHPPRRLRALLAGSLAAAAALAATELVGLLAPTRPSLLVAVETWFVDRFAASLKDLATRVFGTGDKAALAAGTIVVAVALGAALGGAERRRPGAGVAGFVAFGLLGVAATARDPLGSVPVAVAAALAGVAAGSVALRSLLDRFGVRPWPRRRGSRRSRSGALAEVTATRRDVLVWGAGSGVAVVAVAAGGQRARSALRASATAVPERLPVAASPARLPPAPPFAVEGLTPYVVPNADFYRIDTALQTPIVDTDTWRLHITGLVEDEIELTYDDLLAHDLVEEVITLSCVSNTVGGTLIGNAVWRGIPLRDLLARAHPTPDATQIIAESIDGFTAGFPTATLDDPDRPALLALGMNGTPLPRAHGFPARLVVSGLYGYVSATKWLTHIRLTTLDHDGYWIPRGWAKDGPVKTQSRIDVPHPTTRLTPGPTPIAGVAWAPNRGITRVQVRIDRQQWHDAQLAPTTSDDTWVQWHHPWTATPGDHTIEVRATDTTGTTQPANRTDPLPDGAEGWHTIDVRVRRS